MLRCFFFQHDSKWHDHSSLLPNEVTIRHWCHPAWRHNLQDCSLSTYLMPGCPNLACISLFRPSAIGYYCCFNISATREMFQWHHKHTKEAITRCNWLASSNNIMYECYLVVSFNHKFQVCPSLLMRLPRRIVLWCSVISSTSCWSCEKSAQSTKSPLSTDWK